MNVIVPSFRRPEQCAKKTLSTLARQAPGARVQVWLSDPQERPQYERAAKDAGVHEHVQVTFHDGQPLLGPNRRAAYAAQDAGWVLSMDDDIERMIYRVSGKEAQDADIARFFDEGTALADMMGVTLFGVYPVANPFFMKADVRSGLYFIYGATYAEKVTPGDMSRVPEARYSLRDDIQRSLLHWRAGGSVLRFDEYAVVQKYLTNEGGLQHAQRTEAADTEERQRILDTWPGVTKAWQRSNGRHEIKLLDPSKARAL
jgi:hypothetical protein